MVGMSVYVKVELLSRLRSPYLLGLVGHCSDSNHRLLVYEFMANGGLQEHLYPARGMWIISTFTVFIVLMHICINFTNFYFSVLM